MLMSDEDGGVAEVDGDLVAAVDAAVEAVDEVDTASTAKYMEGAVPSSDASSLSEWANEWLWNDRSHLSRWFPKFEILQSPAVNVAILSAGFIALAALIWNLFNGLASGCVVADPAAGCTLDWGAMLIDNMLLQKGVIDSTASPGEPDWFGSVLIFLSASLVWATMPCDD